MNEFFGETICTYTRAQALEDGVLIDAGPMAGEAGFKWPVAITTAAWEDCVAWTEEDDKNQTHQDQPGRLWDVLFMAWHAINTNRNQDNTLWYQLYRVPRDGKSKASKITTLKLIAGPGDQGEPVITILLADED